MSRLAACAAVGVGAGGALSSVLKTGAPSAAARVAGRAPFSLAEATHETFAAFVGTTFRISTPKGDWCEAVLERVIRVPDATGHRPAAFREPFTMRFLAARGGRPLQATCDVRHDTLGRLALYVVASPHGAGDEHVYEAVFG